MTFEARADLELAIYAAREAGTVVMQSFRTEQKVMMKAPDQPLTDADLAADSILRRILLGNRPDYGWLSEETADRPDRLHRRFVWVVDPIDGTNSFIKGYAEFAISVGLVENHRAVLGVVFNPATDELYAAIRGQGAWLEGGNRLHVRTPPAKRELAASRSELKAGEFAAFTDFELREKGSTAYKLALVAAGAADGFLSRGPKSEWDVCAGALIVDEAGGRATDLRGRELVYNRRNPGVYGILAGSSVVHAELVDRVAALPPTRGLADFEEQNNESENR